jgi:hypothetical protein
VTARHDHFEVDAFARGRLAWQSTAACPRSGLDFFSLDPEVQRQCIEICHRCPVTSECLRYAVETRELEGVWAGEVLTKRRLRLLARRLGERAVTAP